jgi:hypothetical protein
MGADPPVHKDAVVIVRMARSRVSAAGGGRALFAMNFAARGVVRVELVENVIGGSLDIVGGLARPDVVVDATTAISSRQNLYAQEERDLPAWQIVGGGSAPSGGAGASSNSARVDSTGDRIERFRVGIVGFGGRRFSTKDGPSSANKVELDLRKLRLQTREPEAADFVFAGALSTGLFSAGDANIVTVLVRQTRGSGRRENLYADSVGFGTGNRLTFRGSPAAFNESNAGIEPSPPAEFF